MDLYLNALWVVIFEYAINVKLSFTLNNMAQVYNKDMSIPYRSSMPTNISGAVKRVSTIEMLSQNNDYNNAS